MEKKIYSLELKKAIQKGLNSGVSTKTISDIMAEVERMMKTNGKF